MDGEIKLISIPVKRFDYLEGLEEENAKLKEQLKQIWKWADTQPFDLQEVLDEFKELGANKA